MFHIVIPARYGSTRLPGKALVDIAGKPMVWWVWQRALSTSATSVIVATDHEEIAAVMTDFGADVQMTKATHPSGTDRLAEVVERRGWADDTVVVNLQGDEPLMPESNIHQVATELSNHPGASIATLAEPISSIEQFADPSVVKVVVDAQGKALYFSRAPIPFSREGSHDSGSGDGLANIAGAQRHAGLYAYRAGFLRQFVTWEQAPIERRESLEQLRALYQGCQIRVITAAESVPPGVDTEADLAVVRRILDV
jgi:3-deoxy-manno-octulosonate cytidylyltransferase (CMP-KDO synthetase)